MQNTKPFILFVAGEDSGDIIGEHAVASAVKLGFSARGIGGNRMQNAGLKCLVPFRHFPVSGFFDVLPRVLFFKRMFKLLCEELSKPECSALCAVDYPGLNVKLAKYAKKIGKQVLYLAPPQIFAWKAKRAVALKDLSLAVFFPFEKSAYAKYGVETTIVEHPFVSAVKEGADLNIQKNEKKILLLPGSRRAALKRNMPIYANAAEKLLQNGYKVAFVAARKELKTDIEKILTVQGILVEIAEESAAKRYSSFASADCLVAPPGTSLFEASVSGTNVVAAIRPDILTYCLGKCFLHVDHLALPNLLLKRRAFEELVFSPFELTSKAVAQMVNAVQKKEQCKKNTALELRGLLGERQKTVGELSLEFFGKFLPGQTQ